MLDIAAPGPSANGIRIHTNNASANAIMHIGGGGSTDVKFKVNGLGIVSASAFEAITDSGYSAIFTKTNNAPAIKFMGVNSTVGLNYSFGVDAVGGNNNKFHINRVNDADQFVANLLTIKSDGNVGINAHNPGSRLEVVEDPISNGNDLLPKKVLTLMRPDVSGVTYAQRANLFLRKYEGDNTSGVSTQARTQLDITLAHSNGENGEVSNIDGSNERIGGTTVLSLRSDGFITIGGRLGVGTTPQEKFHVNGTVKLDDTLAPTTTTNKLYSIGGKLYWNGSELASGSSSNFAAANHTHAIANITGLQTALNGKASSSHTHAIANITGLQTALDGKASSSHTHAIANITGLQTALNAAGSSNVDAINDLSDVNITSLSDNDILYYDSSSSKWVNDAPTEPAFISDKKYKTKIFPISDALSKVNSIRGANFTWSDDAPSNLGGKKDVGVIAQDIQKVLPEAVEEKENGDLTVKYQRIIPLLIESIKELSEENKTLKSRLDKIEGTS